MPKLVGGYKHPTNGITLGEEKGEWFTSGWIQFREKPTWNSIGRALEATITQIMKLKAGVTLAAAPGLFLIFFYDGSSELGK